MPILCATDFSPSGDAAVQLAAVLGRRMGWSLVLAHAVEAPAFDVLALGDRVWEEALEEVAQARVSSLAATLRQGGHTVETRVLVGDPAKLILAAAREISPELIAVGTHGRKGAARLFLGSVAEQIARGSAAPVLVARADATELARWEAGEPLRFVVAVDDGPAGDGALAWTGRLARRTPCDVTIVRVFGPAQVGARYGLGEPWEGAPPAGKIEPILERDLAARIARVQGPPHPRIHYRPAQRDLADAVIAEVDRVHPDALIIGVSREHGATWHGLAPGPVLRTSPVPVFCIPEEPPPAGVVKPTRTVLAAADLSDASRTAIVAAYGLLPGGGHVAICHVHERGRIAAPGESDFAAPLADRERARIEDRLRALVPPEAERLGITTTVHVVEGRVAAEAILQAAESLNVDVIAVASHGRSGLRRAVIGSVAEEVARHARHPVLIAHTPKGAPP
jgi:nucleotide-binding universal stress UspA family protein